MQRPSCWFIRLICKPRNPTYRARNLDALATPKIGKQSVSE